MKSLQDAVLHRMRRAANGRVFATRDFLDLGSRAAVDQSLSRSVRNGDLQRIARGLFTLPRINQRLGISVPPNPSDIADAVARQTGCRVAPSGATCANRLGLSTQVPAQLVFVTDGRSRSVKVGNSTVRIRHASPRLFNVGDPQSTQVFLALQNLGKDGVDDSVLLRLRQVLTRKQRKQLLKDADSAPAWIARAVREIVNPQTETAAGG